MLCMVLSGQVRKVDASKNRDAADFVIKTINADDQTALCSVPLSRVVRDELASTCTEVDFNSIELEADTYCELASIERDAFDDCVSRYWPTGAASVRRMCVHSALRDLPNNEERDINQVERQIRAVDSRSPRSVSPPAIKTAERNDDDSLSARVARLEFKLSEVDSSCRRSFKSLDAKLNTIVQKLTE
eukprot:SAG11_NODE_2648_length_3128_cov_1.284252_4_plen_188_part_00